MTRKNNDLPYTSNVAEANVESQINARFKRKQKMQWNRQNAHNVLQLRSQGLRMKNFLDRGNEIIYGHGVFSHDTFNSLLLLSPKLTNNV